jgi:predicted secreted hydrolase
MTAYAFVAPVLPGKIPGWRAAVAEMKGKRKAEHDASRKRIGLKTEQVWLQHTPMGDFAVVYFDADDPEAVLGQFATSQEPYAMWFRDTVLVGAHGLNPKEPPPPMNERIL